MSKQLYLLDGMALVYRAHFALISSPIFASGGRNTSALFGFVNTLLDILNTRHPSHLAIAFDTEEPTERHRIFPAYKAHREDMPEDIAFSLPHIDRLAAGFRIPVLRCPGYEADDVIGTLARQAEKEGFTSHLVTPDKDFAQLVDSHTFLYRPGRSGAEVEILGVDDVLARWEIREPSQVIDVLGLWGDASDNVPGIPGIGEKTAKKLIGQYGTIENVIAHAGELKGKLQERVRAHAEQALLCKRLVTIDCNVPVPFRPADLERREPDLDALRALFVEFEFSTLGKRLFGDEFRAAPQRPAPAGPVAVQQDLFAQEPAQTVRDVPHRYTLVADDADRRQLARDLAKASSWCFDIETDGLDPKVAHPVGIAFSLRPHEGFYVPVPEDPAAARRVLEDLAGPLGDDRIEKTGHNLKFDIGVLRWNGVEVRGPLFDTMLAHYLVDPDHRHGLDALAGSLLGYTPIPITALIGQDPKTQINMRDVPVERVAEYAAEDADVALRLRERLIPLLEEKGQKRVFYEIEMPLIHVLVDMELEGFALRIEALRVASAHLEGHIASLEQKILELAGTPFNVNSPRQLGEILFDRLKIVEGAKRTRSGQYATSEQVLEALAPKHEIVRCILEHREAAKLKSTYVDALPLAVHPRTGRIHSHFSQTGAATGRLASSDPNLQNIPIRSDLGQDIRRAFVARGPDRILLSADYSQIELRVMAEMSGDQALRDAFEAGHDIHASTASRVYGIALQDVDAAMRRTAKMVNFGIIYGISAFGLAQRLGISRGEASALIGEYFRQYPGVRAYMERTVAACRASGYVETMTGRRRYVRDIQSANETIRSSAERIAINSPIQGTAADMIKLAMNRIHGELRRFETRLILQVHDELVFDMKRGEEPEVRRLVESGMKNAIPMSVPILVEMGTGENWLEAH
jgi:DNA polymerase I